MRPTRVVIGLLGLLGACSSVASTRGPTGLERPVAIAAISAALKAVWWADYCPDDPPCLVRLEHTVQRTDGDGIPRDTSAFLFAVRAADFSAPPGVDTLADALRTERRRVSGRELWVTIGLNVPVRTTTNRVRVQLEVLPAFQSIVTLVIVDAVRSEGGWRATVASIQEP